MTADGAPGMTMNSVPAVLKIKHRLAVSPFAGPISRMRDAVARLKALRYPELGLLQCEDRMIDALLTRLVARDADCLDVGAHVGSVSHRLRTLAPDGSLTIVEASPGKSAMLSASFPDATLHAVAVSDADGEVSFFENLSNPGFSSLADRRDRGETREIRVAARKLDDLMAGANVDFLKIDVEGYEYAALRGAADLLRRCQPIILFEAGALDDSAIDAEQADKLFDLLTQDFGYRIYAAFDLFYDRGPIDRAQFASYRRYPFFAFNYFAVPDAAKGNLSGARP